MVAIKDLLSDFQQTHKVRNVIEAQYERSRIEGGDILLSIKATIGRVDVVPSGFRGNISRDIARIRTREEICQKFVKWLLSSDNYQRYFDRAIVGTTRAKLSINVLRKLFITLPKHDEQVCIADALEEISASIASEQMRLKKLRRVKLGVMHDLLATKVPVPIAAEEAGQAVGALG